jgi:hypothetical protein
LFRVCEVACLSLFLWRAQGAPPFFLCVLFSSLFLFFFFSGRWSDCPGGYTGLSQWWLWEYHVPLICSPVGLCLPCRLGSGVWQLRNPPCFSV